MESTEKVKTTSAKKKEKSLGFDNALPKLPMKTILAMTFGCIGVNMAFTLQGSQMSRITQTIGVNPNSLGWFFLLPPLLGMFVQPLLGKYSDSTWTRWGRRIPYLIVGAPITVVVMVLLPFTGSFGFGYGSMTALIYAAIAIALMDLFSNVCLAPYKMLAGDMVNEDQKNLAWSWQQIFSYAGGILAALLPFILTKMGIANTAAKGQVPLTVIWAYLIGAAMLLITSVVTILNVKEYNPETYAKYHKIKSDAQKVTPSLWKLLKKAPRAFWELSVVQLFSWIGIMYTWTYATGAMANNIWHTTNPASAGFQAAGNWYGVMTAFYSVAALIWGLFYAKTKANQRKLWYSVGLFADAISIIIVATTHSQWIALIAFALYGIGNFTINTLPFTMLTTSLDGKNNGSYLGLFNIAVCLPQIIGSLASFVIFPMVGSSQSMMMIIGFVAMVIGGFSVAIVHEGK
ncbi:SLC45 family MFS transporter [Companilactobacillus bobalius]|uniref:Sucrose transport protein SUC4 n=2 Tax=Companilactobacillus bobalius TaxID=2801451 RepID=A0A202FF06_9LACO|nr:SLC45 family MFS transporter [Companilactobacillus bobalius]KAE9560522.1 MFS transporter [Companilactobacillus bobalius]KRK83287.1 sugar transport protein [Companilactobacillus bobalius DSM 19674]OVE99020.1 Sucrose transport protein SUC4 [Companilactobacillus bobalius]GEO56996.1 MFS transporter [Companilactobacillus paralimentarius]